MIFAIDFDGTIVEACYPEIGEELPDAIKTIKALHDEGHQILIWTCRTLSHKMAPGLHEMIAWLDERDCPYEAINCNIFGAEFFSMPKVYADVYIDDKSFPPFEGWDSVRKAFLGEKDGK